MKLLRASLSCKVVLGLSLLTFTANAGWSQSFTLSTSPKIVTIHPGDQNVPITVSVSNSTYGGPINITLTGLPSGISVSSLTLNSGGSGTLNISASDFADQEAFPANAPTNPNSVTNTVDVVGVAGSTVLSFPLKLIVSLTNPSFVPAAGDINLPIVTIDTSDVAVTSKAVHVPGTITITSADGQTSYLPNASDGDNTATFHVHGNSTAYMPKLSYAVKLNTSLDLLNTMGLTCPYVTSSGKKTCDKSKSYVLLANYDDKTFLRDWAASALANAIPIGNGCLNSPANSPTPSGTSTLMPWAPHSLFVELYLNGVYEGNYQLIEKVNVDSHRLNLSELSETDTTDDITGGYLLEIDARQSEAFNFITPRILAIGLVDPDFSPDPEVSQQTAYISNYVDTAENWLFGINFADPTHGWRTHFDEASVVNFYIVNDIMGNVDGGKFYSSDYLYKAKDNPLLYMGPVWDFDISSGNVNYAPIANPTVPWMQSQANWYRQWFRDTSFKADVATQWNALKNNGVFAAWLASINQEAATLQQSQANNFGRWPMQGIKVWPNPEAAGSYSGEVSYLTNWINLRISYLDSLFNGKEQTSTALAISDETLRQGTSATLSASVTGGTNPTGNVSFLSGSVVLGTGALDGSGNAILTTNNLPAGTDNMEAVYSGDSKNSLSASDVIPVTVLTPLVSTATSLSSSVSNVNPQTPANLTVVVLGNSGTTTPAGTVTFIANGQSLGAASLTNNGLAIFSPTLLPSGVDSVQAIYSGDETYQGSTSNAVTLEVEAIDVPVLSQATGTYSTAQNITITDATPGAAIHYTTDGTVPTAASTLYSGTITVSSTETLSAIAVLPDYSPSAIATATYTITPSYDLTATPTSLSIRQGQKANATLTLTPVGGFNGKVTFRCSNLPADTVCIFSQPSVQMQGNNQPVNVGLTIKTNVQQARIASLPKPLQDAPGPLSPALAFWWPGMLAGCALLEPKRRLLKKRPGWLHFSLLLIATGGMFTGLSGCQTSGPVTPAGTSIVTVTATTTSGSNMTRSAEMNLTIVP